MQTGHAIDKIQVYIIRAFPLLLWYVFWKYTMPTSLTTTPLLPISTRFCSVSACLPPSLYVSVSLFLWSLSLSLCHGWVCSADQSSCDARGASVRPPRGGQDSGCRSGVFRRPVDQTAVEYGCVFAPLPRKQQTRMQAAPGEGLWMREALRRQRVVFPPRCRILITLILPRGVDVDGSRARAHQIQSRTRPSPLVSPVILS